MIKNSRSYILITLLLFLSASCSQSNKKEMGIAELKGNKDFLFETEVNYAEYFIVNNYPDYKELIILDSENKDTITTYILTLNKQALPEEVSPKGARIIEVPIQKIACLSAAHVGALEKLGLVDKVVGVSNINQYWGSEVNRQIELGKIKEIAKGNKINIEKIVSLSPDVLVKNDHTKGIHQDDVKDMNITILHYNDWREKSMLARAEWIKVIGLLFCESQKTDSIFNHINDRYQALTALAKTAKDTPRVFIAQEFRGTWFLSGNRSYIPSMVADAQANIKTVEGTGTSIPSSFETAYINHQNDDFWFSLKGGTISTLDEFESASEHYKRFKAFQNKNVYFNNKKVKPEGGNDFWESGVCSPDIVLKDLIKILHPELLPEYELYYWRKLN